MKKIYIKTLAGMTFETENTSIAWVVDGADETKPVVECKDASGRSVGVPLSSIHYMVEAKEGE